MNRLLVLCVSNKRGGGANTVKDRMANSVEGMVDGISYQIVTSDQYEECVAFFYAHFLAYEPLTQSRGCCTQRGYRITEMDKVVFRMLKSGLSWCAIDEATNEIIGLRLCCGEFIDDLPENTPTLEQYIEQGWPDDYAPILVLNDAVLDHKAMMKQYKKTKMLNLFAVGTHVAYRRMGVASELVRLALLYGAECGYSYAGVQCNSKFSQKLFEKQGFQQIKEIVYATYRLNGEIVFESVEEPHKSIIGYVKEI